MYIVIDAVKEGRSRIIKMYEKGNFLDCDGNNIPNEHLKGKRENDKWLVGSDQVLN
ncbi:MAG: hypothetical protein IIA61_14520 [Candidatus Marinimicrobia bacterium]|nr:hypothetical protein [Candidatus Neomarinimicrobiota bacterium]